MHQGLITDAISQRGPIDVARAEPPHHPDKEICALHQGDAWIEFPDSDNAFTPDFPRATDQHRHVKQHLSGVDQSGTEFFAGPSGAGRLGKESVFVVQLGIRTVTKRLDVPKHKADIGTTRKDGRDSGIMAARNNIVVVKEVHKSSPRARPGQISYDAWPTARGFGVT